jgi:ABC-type nitrate/sulfonate/bicarbonate transport system substrate-binding protein
MRLMRVRAMHGLAMADIVPVFAPTDMPSGPISVSEADGWMMWDPYTGEIEARGGFRNLFDGTERFATTRVSMPRGHV